jgi:predicted dehydrogenase/sugar phosphate isomerase/epimerase
MRGGEEMMQVEISGFYDEVSGELDEQIAECRRLGGHYICPRGVDGKNIADYTLEEFETQVKPRLVEAGISFSSIGSPIGKIPWNDEAAFLSQQSKLKELIKIAQSMGCSFIRVFAFYCEDEEKEKAYPTIKEKFAEFLAIAHGSGVRLLFEDEKKVYGSRPEEILRLYTDLKSPDLALCFDASNYIQCGVDPLEAFHLLKDHLSYIHIKDCSKWGVEVPFGLGQAHYDQIFRELKAMNYHGFITLEPHLFKYALLKPWVYFLPFGPLFARAMFKSFRLVDKAMHVSFFKKISRREVFEWQYELVQEELLGAKRPPLKEVRYGIVGIGKQGSLYCRFFQKLHHKLKGTKLTAVCDIDPTRREWAKKNLPGVKVYDNYQDLLASGLIDVVMIDTPHYLHPEIAIAAFKAGINVLSDKPAGVYLKQVKEENAEAAKHPELLFGMMFNQRTNKLYIAAKELMDSGRLGKITRIVWIITDWYRPKAYYAQGGWRGTWWGEGGGVLLNQCPHQLDLFTWFMGLPDKITANLKTVGRDINVENDVTAMMSFPNGASGVFITSTHDAPGTNRLEITGEGGKIVIEKGKLTFTENVEMESKFSAHNTVFMGRPKTKKHVIKGTPMKFALIEDLFQHVRIIRNYTDVLQGKTHKFIAPGVEGIRGLTLSNAIHLSGWTHQEISLPIDDELFLSELAKRKEEEKASSKK